MYGQLLSLQCIINTWLISKSCIYYLDSNHNLQGFPPIIFSFFQKLNILNGFAFIKLDMTEMHETHGIKWFTA